jgi:hypothetical protein
VRQLLFLGIRYEVLPRPPLLLSVRVDVLVHEYSPHPRAEIRSRAVFIERRIRPRVGVLHEVLCIGRVARHPPGGGKQGSPMCQRVLLEPSAAFRTAFVLTPR